MDLDLLTLSDCPVFIEFDGLAVNDLGHGLHLRLFVLLFHLTLPLLRPCLLIAAAPYVDPIFVLNLDPLLVGQVRKIQATRSSGGAVGGTGRNAGRGSRPSRVSGNMPDAPV